MNRVVFPLKVGSKGPEVLDLQAALRMLVERAVVLPTNAAARNELSLQIKGEGFQSTYGEGTKRVVGLFQTLRHLSGEGDVDEATAGGLNALLREWGVL